MNETYTVCFRIDYDQEQASIVVLENGKNGEPYVVNIIQDDEIIELYERLTGREPY